MLYTFIGQNGGNHCVAGEAAGVAAVKTGIEEKPVYTIAPVVFPGVAIVVIL